MTAAACPDEEFIELWRHHGSASVLARVLQIDVRNVRDRRVRLERKYRMKLETVIKPPPPRNIPERHAAIHQLKVKDGHVVVFSDAHFWPGIRTTAFRGLLRFVKDLRPVAVICNGDAFDGASISRFPRIGWDKTPSVIQELKACKAALGEIEEVAGKAKLIWPLGNHDARFETRLANQASEFEGVTGFHLKDHLPAWTPCWRLDVNDDVVIKHRYKGGIGAARANTLNSGKTMVTGHLHQLKVTPFADYNGNRYGVDTGTLAEPMGPQFENYLESGVPDWRSGFAVLTFKDSRLLMPQLVQKWDEGAVEFAGKVYDVSKE
ncbi:MAG: metallophosphoesterase [Verrucomicrobiota bacterium]